jgi:hypothetical protein
VTAQPDEAAKDKFVACLLPVDPDLMAELDLAGNSLSADSAGRVGGIGPNENHYGDNCEAADGAGAVEVPVQSVDSPLQIALVLSGGSLEAWVNDTLIGTTDSVPSLAVYGLFSQTYHRERTHVHFDNLTISN